MGGAQIRLLAVGLFLLAMVLPAAAEKRVALIIGNAAYQNTPPLANPTNDAADMAVALEKVGFTVQVERDVTKRGMEAALSRFARLADGADAALFFYAGHGVQYRGTNYLVPVDARLEDDVSVNYELLRIDDVLFSLERAKGVKLLLLDACRNNPLLDRLARRGGARDASLTRGLARIDNARGMVVAYATQADQVAVDGSGRNSPFTEALIKYLAEPGLEVGTLLRRVAIEVDRATSGRQLPETWVTLRDEFYLNTRESDLQVFARVRDSDNPDQLADFMRRFPASQFAPDVRQRLEAAITRQERARAERDRLERERVEAERTERLRQEQAEAARREAERLAQEKSERERLAREAAARAEAERTELLRKEQADASRREAERLAQEKSERERLAREIAARAEAERAERLRKEQAEAALREIERAAQERQRLAREAAARAEAERAERLRKEQAEAERVAKEKAESERLAQPAQSSPNTQVAMLPPPASAAPDTPSGAVLVRGIKTELKRIGCLSGEVDEQWSAPQTRSAVTRFVKFARLASTPDLPTSEFLDALKRSQGRVCPLECGARQVERNGHCVAKVCPRGEVLTRDGDCEERARKKDKKAIAARTPPSEAAAPSQAAPPSESRPQRPAGGGGAQAAVVCGNRGCRSGSWSPNRVPGAHCRHVFGNRHQFFCN